MDRNKTTKMLGVIFVAILLPLLPLLPTTCFAAVENWFFKPYVGIDEGWQTLRWEHGKGDLHFNGRYPYYNICFGFMMHKYLGFDFGYSTMVVGQRRQFYPSGTPVLGFLRTPPEDTAYISEARMKGFNANVVLTYPVPKLKCTALMGVVGASWQQAYLNTMIFIDNTASANPLTEWGTDRKAVLKLGLGVRQMITANFGARILYVWENTSQLEGIVAPGVSIGGSATPTLPHDFFTAHPKDSHALLIGLFYQDKWA